MDTYITKFCLSLNILKMVLRQKDHSEMNFTPFFTVINPYERKVFLRSWDQCNGGGVFFSPGSSMSAGDLNKKSN